MQRDPLAFLERTAREHGDAVRLRFGPQLVVMLGHPEDIRDVLVTGNRDFVKGRALDRAKLLLGEGLLTSAGELHLRQRRLVQPAFHRERVAGYAATMVELAARLGDRWRAGETLDVAAAMNRLALAIAGRTLFSADVEGEADELGDALTQAMLLFDLVRIPFSDWLLHLPFLPATRRFRRARARLDATIYRLIGERRASGEDRGDLLSMLMLARDDATDGARMTDLQLRDEALTLFLAGHETTANALAWMWYLLARHPDAERALHEELDAVLGARLPTVDDVPRLTWTRAVMAEAMRLYPPAWILGRRAVRDHEMHGWRIPEDAVVIMSQWVVHRDPRWWEAPDEFRPGRWTAGAEGTRPKFAYFPFGGGPRLCIGEQFAWTEGILVMATLARRWRLRLVPGQTVRPLPLITLRPRDGIRMTVEERRA